MWDENCFITLTYAPEHLPKDKSIEKRTLQLFIKRLRKHLKGKEIKFYACGEYGDKKGRPHYHACIFGHDFKDKVLFRFNNSGDNKGYVKQGINSPLYTSPTLERLWRFGFSTIGEVTIESAGYVARYILKKITGEKANEYYQNKTPEFALMSRRPGIGKKWFKKYHTDVYPKDFFTINGVKCKPPRYYDDLLKKRNPDLHIRIKKKRREKAKEEEIIRLKQKENHKILTAKQLQRSLEDETT